MVTKIAATWLVLSLSGAPAQGEPPTDAQIDKAVKAVNDLVENAKGGFDQAAARRLAGEQLASIDLSEASLAQIVKLDESFLLTLAGKQSAASARLVELAKDPGAQGAIAAAMRASFIEAWPDDTQGADEQNRRRDEVIAIFRAALEHPGVAASFKTDSRRTVLVAIASLDPKTAAALLPSLLGLEPAIAPGMHHNTIGALPQFVRCLADIEPVDADKRERIRAKVAGALDAALTDASISPKTQKWLERGLAYVNGAHARGLLVGYTAPSLDFLWSTLPGGPKSLAELKGKVVVLDFWATWCVPCVGSFPHTRELQQRYADSDVVILGVTSVQGSFFNYQGPEDKNGKPIDTKGKPETEFELMPAFMKKMNMTWPVAFTKQAVYNPDFGISGIPWVAIIDCAGKVKNVGLHPADDAPRIPELIDALLTEAGKPVPKK